ncbi:MAG: methionine--tRNA ligase [Candidatus Omnitrophota bacterium]|nr:MAG: methionine--tRNA ligase [Candidatus Omnitrophota bacterium]
MKKLYITSPLYYVNASPHIGHAYTQIACDTINRFFKMAGFQTYFMTGTDEHGEKVEKAAVKAGYEKGREKDFVDSVVPHFKELWKDLNIKFDFFIRTTDPSHEKTVQKILEIMKSKDDIYKGHYNGWFCTPCETFWTELQVKGKPCPDCGRRLEKIEEANYFFRLSKYQDWLISHIKKNEDFIKPDYRKNEILSFLKNPLEDLCISRPKERMAWGVELPFAPNFVTYVWFDALINYISGMGFLDDEKKFKKFWPADFHIIGKDILRHHAIYWPIMLRSAGLAPPKTIFAHGWWTVKGEKMSKSKGNIVDPRTVIKLYGTDALRYFLLREVTFGLDGTFSEEAFILRFNGDLANDLGNLVNRTLTMVDKYFSGKIPEARAGIKNSSLEGLSRGLKDKATHLRKTLESRISSFDFSGALSAIWEVINKANKYIEESKPWECSRNKNTKNLESIIRNLLETLRIISISIYPFMPVSSQKIWQQLGIKDGIEGASLTETEKWNLLKAGHKTCKDKPLFPRIV